MFAPNPNSKSNLSGMNTRKTIDKLTVGPTEGKIQEMLSGKASNKASKSPSDVASAKSKVNTKKKRKLNLLAGALSFALLLLPIRAFAQSPSNPCEQTNNIKQAVVSASGAATTKLIDNGTNPQRQILVCSLNLTIVSNATAQTIVFNQGTGATCGTGNTAITGVMSGGITDTIHFTDRLPFARLIAGNSLCATTTTAPLVAGVVTYVFIGQATP